MSKLNKFKVPTYYICSVMALRNGTVYEVFLYTGIATEPQVKEVRVEGEGTAYVLLDFSTFKTSNMFQLLQQPNRRYTCFKVYSIPDIERDSYKKEELTLEFEINDPTIHSVSKTLGISLDD